MLLSYDDSETNRIGIAGVEKTYHYWALEQESRLLQGVEELQVTDPSESIVSSLATPSDSQEYTFRTTIQTHNDYVSPAPLVGKPAEPIVAPAAPLVAEVRDKHLAKHRSQDPLIQILLSWLQTCRDQLLHPDDPAEASEADDTLQQTTSVSRSPFNVDNLPRTIHDLYHHLQMEPEDEKFPVLITRLPEEIFEHVIEFLDVSSLETLALVCKKFRVLTRGVNKWR